MATSQAQAKFGAAELLQRTLSSEGNEKLLHELKTRAEEVLAAIEATDIPIPDVAERDPLWIARVYEALSFETEVTLTPEQQQLEQKLFESQQGDLTAIGEAFVETLLPDLPVDLVKFNVFFANAPRISPEELQLLSDEPDVTAAFRSSTDFLLADLLLFGVRPLTVFYASEAVAALLDRLLRYGLIEERELFLTSRHSDTYVPAIAERNLSVSIPGEIALMADCDVKTSELLLKWLINVAEYKPFVFTGFEADPRRDGVLLKRTSQTFGDLYRRWSVSLAGVR